MASTRRIFSCAVAATVALFAMPALASADVYCVDLNTVGCDDTGYTAEPGLQNALNDAATHDGADTVRIAPLAYDTNPANPDGATPGSFTTKVKRKRS
jgi:hypothetical protein